MVKTLWARRLFGGFAATLTATAGVAVGTATTAAADAPTGVTAAVAAGAGVVTVSWTDVDGTSWEVFQDTNPAGLFATPVAAGTCLAATPPVSGCTVTGLTPGTTYYFKVIADGDPLETSAASNGVVAINVPNAATAITPTAYGNGSASVSWTETPTLARPVTTRNIEVSLDAGAYLAIPALEQSCATNPCIVDGLTIGETYTFKVELINAAGEVLSAESGPVTAVMNGPQPGASQGMFADLGGDGKDELVYVTDDVVRAFTNVNGGYPNASAVVAADSPQPNITFADVSGDGKADLISMNTVTGVLTMHPPSGTPTVIGSGFTAPATTYFGDINGDKKAELIYLDGSTLWAFKNVNGIHATLFAYPESAVMIGTGFAGGDEVQFADLNGDAKDELVYRDDAGTLHAFRNVNGFNAFPYTESSHAIGYGFGVSRYRFGHMDGDGKAELIYGDMGGVLRSFQNVNGLSGFPYPYASSGVGTGWDPARITFNG